MTRSPLVWFTAPVVVLGGCVIAFAAWHLPSTPYPLGWVALGALALVAASFGIKVPGVSAWISISDTFFITSVLLFGAAPATVSIALDSLVMSWRRGHGRHQLLFNPTSSAIALWSAAQVYFALGAAPPLMTTAMPPTATTFVPLAIMAAVYFALNSGLTVIAVGLDKKISPLRVWRRNFAVLSLNYFAAASASFFLIVLIQYGGIATFVAVLPLICICYLAMRSWLGRVEDAQRHVDKVNQMYLSTIGAFSTAIEAKDGVTSDHVHRVQAYALGLARAMRITDDQTLKAIETAALLHDTGKLAVPEHILNKPGRLTDAEFETMKTHVDVGADILSSIDFPYPVVPIVRAHHENWDGTGYPHRVAGAAIPIGARILSVVDCFDALTSDRPYRPAMTEEQALAIIVERRGTMYDPDVVDTFMRVYREIAPSAPQAPMLQSAVRQIRRVYQPVATPAPAPAADAVVAPDSSDELLAFVSLARVVSQPASSSDVVALGWGHLKQLVRGSTMALFTADTAPQGLSVQYAVGPAADRLHGRTITVGHGVSGWVAANWRSMINAQAALDLGPHAGDLHVATSIPLVSEARLVGVMTLYGAEPFSELQTRQLELIAPHFATALAAAADSRAQTAPRDLRLVSRR